MAELQATSDALLGYFVNRCRDERYTWLEISNALGVTKQAVHKRFAEPSSTPHPQSLRRGELSDLERDFDQSCRAAIEVVKRLGFMPGGWIGLIYELGAKEAAHHLLSTGTVLPIFQFLVGSKRVDLCVEWAVLQPEWRDLFSDDDRSKARKRLQDVGVELDD